MKRILITLCALVATAFAVLALAQTQTQVRVLPGTTFDAYVGTRKHSEHQTLDACISEVSKFPAGQYGCRSIVRLEVPPPPATTPPVVVTPPVVTPPPMPPVTQVGVPWNPALVPPQNVAGTLVGNRVRASSIPTPPSREGTPIARVQCDVSHFATDDPLVFPGQPGRSHPHMFWGNTTTNANTTNYRSDRSTCRGGAANSSGYWIAALIDTRDGRPLVPQSIINYYKGGYNGIRAADFRPWGQGLRMIAGDATNTRVLPSYSRPFRWSCSGVADYHGRIPEGCVVGGELTFELTFPQCWDGVNLDSPDHKSHMAYPSGGRCPASHPSPMPEIQFVVTWTVPAGGTGSLRLSSDRDGAEPGTSGHGDWADGWDPTHVRHLIANCHNRNLDCGTNLLGGGLTLY